MKIEFSAHALMRLQLRGISQRDFEDALENAQFRCYDVETKNMISISSRSYKRKGRRLAVAFQEAFGQAVVITTHPILNLQVQNRISRGGWVKI